MEPSPTPRMNVDARVPHSIGCVCLSRTLAMGVDLCGAILSNARLRGADLAGCDLRAPPRASLTARPTPLPEPSHDPSNEDEKLDVIDEPGDG